MQTFDAAVAARASHLIEKRISEIKDRMALGLLSVDEYHRNAGVIEGLNAAIEYIQDAETAIRYGESRAPSEKG